MVGGLADWFAVTALFRHPLGLPIPHTAIIPRKKDQIGESLAGFVQENFLTAAIVERTRGARRRCPRRVGEWLADPGHAAAAGRRAQHRGHRRSRRPAARRRAAQPPVATLRRPQLRELDAAPLLARVLDAVVDGDQHQEVLSAGAARR